MFDFGVLNYMIDYFELFSGLLIQIRKRWIKVGGGWLYLEQMGNVVVEGMNGDKVKLLCFYVLKFGVNLVFGRKFCFDF